MTIRSRRLAPLALALPIFLSACGGGSSSTTVYNYLTSSSAVLGQTGSGNNSPNAGSSPSANGYSQPLGGAAGGFGTTSFFVPDYGNNRILGYNTAPTATNTPANFVLGQPDFVTANPSNGGAGVFAFPQSAWVSTDNKLVVADTGNNRVLIWNTVPTSNVPPDVVVGQTDMTGNTAGLSQTQLASPSAAAIAGNRLFVVDQSNSRVLIWNTVPTTNGAPADVVLGEPTFTTVPPLNTVTQSSLLAPQGLWTDGFRLLVADTGNNRIMYWTTIPSTNGANANFVIGQSSFTFSTTPPSAQTMNTPVGIASDGTRLFVADKGNNRVLVFNSFPLANNAAADEVLGQQNFTHTQANVDNGNVQNPQSDTPQVTAITGRTMNGPTGAYYLANNLYVTDRGNNRILIYNATRFPIVGEQ